jgi:uncharacterized protein (TIGR00369 family)
VALSELGSFLKASPLHRFLGVTLSYAEPGHVTVTLPFRDELLADLEPPYIHGGVIATLADIAGCFAVISQVGHDVPTVDLRVDYLEPAANGPLEATGKVLRVGRTLAVADVEVRDVRKRLVAVGRGVFRVPVDSSSAASSNHRRDT